MDSSRAFWPAGSKAIAKVDPSVTVSISPLGSKVAKPSGAARREVDSRKKNEANRAEEAKGRKYQDEGRVGRQGEDLETEEERAEDHEKRTVVKEDEDAADRELDVQQMARYARPELDGNTGRSLKYESTK